MCHSVHYSFVYWQMEFDLILFLKLYPDIAFSRELAEVQVRCPFGCNKEMKHKDYVVSSYQLLWLT